MSTKLTTPVDSQEFPILEVLRGAVIEDFGDDLTLDRIEFLWALLHNKNLNLHTRRKIRSNFWYRFFYKKGITIQNNDEDNEIQFTYELSYLERHLLRSQHLIAENKE